MSKGTKMERPETIAEFSTNVATDFHVVWYHSYFLRHQESEDWKEKITHYVCTCEMSESVFEAQNHIQSRFRCINTLRVKELKSCCSNGDRWMTPECYRDGRYKSIFVRSQWLFKEVIRRPVSEGTLTPTSSTKKQTRDPICWYEWDLRYLCCNRVWRNQ